MENTDGLLAKVRALLAKAEGTDNDHEAEAYNAKARDLIARYGIEAAMLAATSPDTDKISDLVIRIGRPYARDKADLLWAVSGPLRCHGLRRHRYDPNTGQYEMQMHLFGYQSDLERCQILYTSLLLQAQRFLAAEPVPPFDHPAAFRRTWYQGFSAGVRARVARAERHAQVQAEPGQPTAGDDGPSVALVLAGRAALVDQAASAAYPKAAKARPRELSGRGLYLGLDAAKRADIGTTRIGGAVPAIEGSAAR